MLGLWTSLRARALPVLTITAHATAPFLAVFIAIHLSAPALANAGGSALASQTLLLGREYYQTALGEPLLLFAPLALHVVSGALKRLLFLFGRKSRPISSPLTMSAIVLGLVLPIHVLTHRVYPSIAASPILAVGPAELDFAFVQTGLTIWPWRNALLYTALVGAAVVHAVEGVALLRRTYLTAKPTQKVDETKSDSPAKGGNSLHPRTKRITLGLALVALPVLSGVYALAAEPVFVFKNLASRYRSAFLESWAYRVL